MIEELRAEIARDGSEALLDHLRLCGAIPEQYGRDSSEEKLYSKYTDAVVSESFAAMGLRSVVVDTRSDSPDIRARAADYSLVADAKAFRLSRTAKNQKDFKVQAMDSWRGELDYTVLVSPIYQWPSRTSQVYQQAIARNVCLLSYAHLAALVGLAARQGPSFAEAGLHELLKSISLLHLSKSALDYWMGVNRALVGSLGSHGDIWITEKIASVEALDVVKREALRQLTMERDRLLGLSHHQAIAELIRLSGIDSRIE